MSIFRDDILAGKTAFITGGGSGICKGITRALMKHGCNTVIVSRNQERLDAAALELEAETGQTCVGHAADVRNVEQIEDVMKRSVDQFGPHDFIINGAAGKFLRRRPMLSPKGFRTVMEIDTQGTTTCRDSLRAVSTRQWRPYLEHLRDAALYGRSHANPRRCRESRYRRHVSSPRGRMGSFRDSRQLYSAGPIDETEGMSRLAPGGMKEKSEQTIPLKRFGTVDEIGDAAVFFMQRWGQGHHWRNLGG